MTTKYKVSYRSTDYDNTDGTQEFEIEILRYSDEPTPMNKVAAIAEARVQILERMGIEFNVQEIRP